MQSSSPDIASRLVKCFSAVFPDLPSDQIPNASQASLEEWDSLASLTLVSVIEEEFGSAIEVDRIPELTSFAAISRYLEQA